MLTGVLSFLPSWCQRVTGGQFPARGPRGGQRTVARVARGQPGTDLVMSVLLANMAAQGRKATFIVPSERLRISSYPATASESGRVSVKRMLGSIRPLSTRGSRVFM